MDQNIIVVSAKDLLQRHIGGSKCMCAPKTIQSYLDFGREKNVFSLLRLALQIVVTIRV
ncbi:hypothetical protein Sjap_015476 [Stephania japonica]|uniref:Uncharacterized protein n=1 Tax=Stephania japonica TaxID=461633 RepID=A0AAP0NSJ4_9MAGN